ncbi:mCG146174, partial [Mus musculus]
VTSQSPHRLLLPHLTKLSNRSMFLRSLTNSPIIFLSNRGFSRSHWATSVLSIGMVRRPFSCRNWIPFFGFWLNCSVPVISS